MKSAVLLKALLTMMASFYCELPEGTTETQLRFIFNNNRIESF